MSIFSVSGFMCCMLHFFLLVSPSISTYLSLIISIIAAFLPASLPAIFLHSCPISMFVSLA